ncbi:FTR1 family iron permease [Parvibium lacunae]|uniref:Iron permease n=1 Tax=Parvibium lacunae TaxID=1888893 RepID=A0A368L470_9BURK|nr:FTR1 family protein [Parvibium lacunae]RCS58374.1 iron permease [Parvibium lacunae]
MLAIALILFRESLEAALIIGIIAAATQGLNARARWISAGIGLGVLGACVVAYMAEHLTRLADGMGQEVFNALVLTAAVVMLAWHTIWMSQHGRELAQQAKQIGHAIQHQQQAMTALLSVIGLAVLREGSEVVLFLHGLHASQSIDTGALWLGGGLGLMAGSVLGWAIYRGLLAIPLSWFFKVTTAWIVLLAAGMSAQATRYLIQADWLPSLADPLWDVSEWLSLDSLLGQTLHLLVGYDPQPTGMQMVGYVLTLVLITAGAAWSQHRVNHLTCTG